MRGRVWHCVDHLAFWVFLGQGSRTPRLFLGSFWGTCFGHAASKVHHLIFGHYVFEEAVTSYVTSQHRMYIGHMTSHYKRSANASFGVLACCSSIHQVRLYCLRPTLGWCLMRAGHDASNASLGWSLLPLNVIIVLALVNSAVSPVGIQVSQ